MEVEVSDPESVFDFGPDLRELVGAALPVLAWLAEEHELALLRPNGFSSAALKAAVAEIVRGTVRAESFLVSDSRTTRADKSSCDFRKFRISD